MCAASPSSASHAQPRLEIAAATRVGPRRTNADAYLIDEAGGLFAVADGVGDTPRSRFVANSSSTMATSSRGAGLARRRGPQ